MPYRPDGDFLQDDQLSSRWDDEPQPPEGGGWWKWAVAVASLAIFGGVLWYAYSTGSAGPSGPVRTVEADTTPYKVKPLNPGGEIIPDQDKLVFNEAVGRPEEVEDTLGQEPETPQAKPEPIPVRKYKPPPPPPKPVEAAPPPATAQAADTPAAQPPASAQASPASGQAPTAPGQAVPATQKPAETAAAPAPTLKPAVVEKPAGPKTPVVQLGAYASQQGAMDSWAEVQKKQGAIVASLSPQVIRISVAGRDLYRLVIGPFTAREDAVRVCGELKAHGRDCIVNAN